MLKFTYETINQYLDLQVSNDKSLIAEDTSSVIDKTAFKPLFLKRHMYFSCLCSANMDLQLQ